MDDRKNDHCGKHENRIEYVEEHLMTDDVTVVSLRVLDQAKHASHEDEGASPVQRIEMFLPDIQVLLNSRSGVPYRASVESDRGHKEDRKEQDLYDETSDDDLLSGMQAFDISTCHDTATFGTSGISDRTSGANPVSFMFRPTRTLHDERYDIATYKYLCEPSSRNEGKCFAISYGDNPTENHINAGSI